MPDVGKWGFLEDTSENRTCSGFNGYLSMLKSFIDARIRRESVTPLPCGAFSGMGSRDLEEIE